MEHMTASQHTSAQDVAEHLDRTFPGTDFTVKVRDTRDGQRRLSVSWTAGPAELYVMSALPAPKLGAGDPSPFDVVSCTRRP